MVNASKLRLTFLVENVKILPSFQTGCLIFVLKTLLQAKVECYNSCKVEYLCLPDEISKISLSARGRMKVNTGHICTSQLKSVRGGEIAQSLASLSVKRPSSRPARSACHRKVRFYHCVIDLLPPVPTTGSKKAVHVLLCLCNNACKRSLAICRTSRALCSVSRLLCPYISCMC